MPTQVAPDPVQAWLPADVAAQGDPMDLLAQFLLGRVIDAPDGWETTTTGGWQLAHHPSLPIVDLVDAERCVGWLLGYPIDDHGHLRQRPTPVAAPPIDERAQWVDRFGGRFLAVFTDGEKPQVWPDPGATFSAVYCPSLGLVASSPVLIPYESTTGDRTELIRLLGIPHRSAMYPVGLTPRHGVDRLLPNHHLDLDDMRALRHGPADTGDRVLALDEAAHRVAAATRRQLDALITAFPSYLQLTAGLDSRMLLACARRHVDTLDAYTLAVPDRSGQIDVAVARKIAHRYGVRHQVVPWVDPDPSDQLSWMYRIGCSVGEHRGWMGTTSLRALDPARVRLGGNIGDLARSGYSTERDDSERTVTVERLVVHAIGHRQLTGTLWDAARSPIILDQLDRWIAASAARDATAMLDHFYLENRIGCWAGVFATAEHYDPGFTVFPLCHRDVIDSVLALAMSDRRSGTLQGEVIAQEWPELLDVPANTPPWSVRLRRLPGALARRTNRLIRPSPNEPASRMHQPT